ncbi:MAG: hypothetical protein IH964_02915, partial [Candidatus Dadabacteria bacterium]|nr:hypothetical protein [Candidatus Dadabacteria bacterium]
MSSTPHVHELSFPIFGRKVGSQAGDEWATIATGFFVLPGIIATAKHV